MQIPPVIFAKALLCLQILCLCNGAPPKKDGQPSSSRQLLKRFTWQEREFIMKELLSLSNDFHEASDTTVWQYLANKIQGQRRLGTEGFPKDRDPRALRDYLKKTLVRDERFMAALPETLIQKLCNAHAVQHRGGKLPYTYEEDKLIVDILSSPRYAHLSPQSNKLWREIARQFHKKRMEGSPGFYADRSLYGLRPHFVKTMLTNPNGRVKVPETLGRKYLSTADRKASGGGPSYTNEENKLIYDLLLSPTNHLPLHDPQLWEEIARQFHIKRMEAAPGFSADRTPSGLRAHFARLIVNDPNERAKVPATLMQKCLTAFNPIVLESHSGPLCAEGSSSQPASQSPQTNLQVPNNENKDDWYELDYSKLDESASPISSPCNLGSDLEYLDDHEDFWDFTDFEED